MYGMLLSNETASGKVQDEVRWKVFCVAQRMEVARLLLLLLKNAYVIPTLPLLHQILLAKHIRLDHHLPRESRKKQV